MPAQWLHHRSGRFVRAPGKCIGRRADLAVVVVEEVEVQKPQGQVQGIVENVIVVGVGLSTLKINATQLG